MKRSLLPALLAALAVTAPLVSAEENVLYVSFGEKLEKASVMQWAEGERRKLPSGSNDGRPVSSFLFLLSQRRVFNLSSAAAAPEKSLLSAAALSTLQGPGAEAESVFSAGDFRKRLLLSFHI